MGAEAASAQRMRESHLPPKISQKGKPAKDLHETEPDVMNQGHQVWVKGLAATVLAQKNG